MSYEQILQRIHAVAHTRTQAELAALLEIKQSSISDSKKRQSIPGDWYIKLFEKIGVNPDWLKQGNGPIYLRTESGYVPSDGEGVSINPDFVVNSPRCEKLTTVYSMRGDYTKEPFSVTSLQPVGKITIPKNYAGNGIIVLEVDNDAASPTIRRGSHVGVNTVAKYPVSGVLFAVLIPYEGVVLRKLFWKQDENCFILRAENPEHPEMQIQVEQIKYILGRLVWVMQEV